MVDNGIFPNIDKLKHTLHITNAGSLDFTQLHTKEYSSIGSGIKKRATSFDVLFFLIPHKNGIEERASIIQRLPSMRISMILRTRIMLRD